MFRTIPLALVFWVASVPPLLAVEPDPSIDPVIVVPTPDDMPSLIQEASTTAPSIDLGKVYDSPVTEAELPQIPVDDADTLREEETVAAGVIDPQSTPFLLTADEILNHPNTTRHLLGMDILPATATRILWKPSRTFSGMAVDTPVLVVNGAYDGPVFCLTAAVHGDELNGIEMVRQVMYELDPNKLHGMIIGVPIVNLLGFSRNSRYLPDRRDLNRYFPGNPNGSVASRIASTFFNDVVKHCNSLVDLHTGSFYRTNIPQLRADLTNRRVTDFVELFGDIPVLKSKGHSRSLRRAATNAGIPTVTLEAGEPMRMQRDMVDAGVKAIRTLLAKSGMYSKLSLWGKPAPAFYSSAWVRSNASGILFSQKELGDVVKEGDILGAVNNPISNEQIDIVSPYGGRILGMALDQFVMPGFAVYHIGRQAAKETLMAADDDMETNQAADPTGVDGTSTLHERTDAEAMEEEGFDEE